jgi:hypothetical protein
LEARIERAATSPARAARPSTGPGASSGSSPTYPFQKAAGDGTPRTAGGSWECRENAARTKAGQSGDACSPIGIQRAMDLRCRGRQEQSDLGECPQARRQLAGSTRPTRARGDATRSGKLVAPAVRAASSPARLGSRSEPGSGRASLQDPLRGPRCRALAALGFRATQSAAGGLTTSVNEPRRTSWTLQPITRSR